MQGPSRNRTRNTTLCVPTNMHTVMGSSSAPLRGSVNQTKKWTKICNPYLSTPVHPHLDSIPSPHSRPVFVRFRQVYLALTIAPTTMVPSVMRGKLAGLFSMSESLGRFVCPMGFATMFAWSISPSSYGWVDHKFVFRFAALSMTVVAVLAWGTITHENMTSTEEQKSGVAVIDRTPVDCSSSRTRQGNGAVRYPGLMPQPARMADLV